MLSVESRTLQDIVNGSIISTSEKLPITADGAKTPPFISIVLGRSIETIPKSDNGGVPTLTSSTNIAYVSCTQFIAR